MKYRYTDVPSLLQGDVPEDDAWSYLSGVHTSLDFHPIMNAALKKKSEKYGCWVWLDHNLHDSIHSTYTGKAIEKSLKARCQAEFEKKHGHDLWMKEFKKNYL